MKKLTVVVCIVLATVAGWGQTKKLVAVNVVSTDARLQAIQPELGSAAAQTIDHFKNARALIIPGEKNAAGDRAREQGAAFLVLIEVSPRSNVTVGFGGTKESPYQPPQGIQTPERAEAQGAIFLKWTIMSLDGKFKWSDDTIVRPETYPLGPEWDWLRAIANRSVRDAANISMKRLEKKKQLD